ncbi:MAG: Nif11-like leader peptide family RiPP precursor [Cyanobium sp.]
MTTTQLQQFLACVSQDPELESRLEARGADPEAIAAAAGFTITAHDYAQSQARWHEWRLSSSYDEEF